MNKRNIGVVTWYNSINYGTCIQAYALTRFLLNKGYNAYIPENLKYYYGIKHPIDSILVLIKKLKVKHNFTRKIIANNKLLQKIQSKFKERIDKNSNFAKKMNNIYSIKNSKDYDNMINETNIFITGSDQIWNPYHTTPPYMLAFANKQHKKIAYSSSIGVEKIPSNKIGIYKKYLSKFNKIGVREKTAQVELSQLLNKDIVTVLDPTFLLNKEEWHEIIDNEISKSLPTKKYIFCYFIGKNRKWENQVKDFAEQNGLEVYCALSESYLVPNVGILKPELGVQEFINYLMHADFVATDSFHAMALSINFNKEFIAYKRFNDMDKNSQNSRIFDILSTFHLLNRLVENNNYLDIVRQDIDYIKTNEILCELRQKSEKFLINAIEE